MTWPAAAATALAGVTLVGALSGCGGEELIGAPSLESQIDVDTPALRGAKADLGIEDCPAAGEGVSELPALSLPCLGGGRSTSLEALAGPAVLSLWASWCTACPDELPLFQRLHEREGDRLQVLGVDYQDTQPDKALELLAETGARFPQLADPGGALADDLRVRALPTVVLVDADGEVTVVADRIEDYAELAALVSEHTGLSVTDG